MAQTFAPTLRLLRPFMEKARFGAARPGNLFTLCLKASLARAYDYAVFAHAPMAKHGAFFLVPTLRSICEDMIVFGLLRTLPREDRESLISNIMHHELLTKIDAQATFFRVERPYQAVLSPGATTATSIVRIEQDIRDVWRKHGWNLSRGTMPQTRQIAEKQGEHVLAALYDFLFRFTSGTVHFNPQVLLRSGWGDPRRGFTFKAANFDRYYLEVARTYSIFLLCLYFERFRAFFRLAPREASAVTALRADLRALERWPEIVTHEEMNLQPPKFQIVALLARVLDAKRNRPLLQKRRAVTRPTT
jgi:hypothetical protein